ncbi:MAG TPA: STT3 domain-containing protein, partial [Methylomirabilota bacterium]
MLALIALGAFALRVGLTYRAVLGPDYVTFVETDAWYHMRLVDALVRDFPHRLWFDPYLQPGGDVVAVGPLFDWIVAGAALLVGAGAPSERLIDLVGAYAPPVMGALTTLPVYVLGRALFSRAAGLFAALLFAAMPGATLLRSLLGFTDHHCAEMLFASTAVMFLVLGLEPGSRWVARRFGGWAAGLALGACLLTWSGGGVLVVILAGWAVVQIAVARERGDDGTQVWRTAAQTFVTALIVIAPWVGTTRYFSYQAIALVSGLAALGVFVRVPARRSSLAWLAATAAGAALMVGAACWWWAPDRLRDLAAELNRLSPFRSSFVAEATPLMASQAWRPVPLWTEFTTSTVLAAAALAATAVKAASRPALGLLVWWTVAFLAATFAQVRFTYYLGIPVALLAGRACAWCLDRCARREAGQAPPDSPTGLRRPGWRRPLVASALVAATTLPGTPYLWAIATNPAAPGDDWVDALNWMRNNTSEPFGDPDAYYARAGAMPASRAYGVLAWWDYGYWIIRLGRRIPIANPKQSGLVDTTAFLLAEDETAAIAVLRRTGARYVIVDIL